jgi:hypothetical protein
MSKQITIGPGGVFAPIEVEQSDDVFWSNNDSKPHWPVPWCYGLRVDPGKPSNSFQAVPGGTLPQKLVYQDALSNQSGVMWVYADFALASGPFAGTAGQNSSVQVMVGGKSKYDASASTGVPSWITFAGDARQQFGLQRSPHEPRRERHLQSECYGWLGHNIQQRLPSPSATFFNWRQGLTGPMRARTPGSG